MSDRTFACLVPDCARSSPDGAPVCPACAHRLSRSLASVPALAGELDTSLARQARSGPGSMGRRSASTPLPYDQAASRAADHLRATLSTWVRLLHEDIGGRPPRDTLTDMAAWLDRRSDWLRMLPYGPECAQDVPAAIQAAEEAVDLPRPTAFAGRCRGCGTACYTRPGAESAACPGCGALIRPPEERERLLRDAADRLVTAAEAARALRAVGRQITPAMVRGYARRGHVRASGTGSADRPLYRLGDVFAVAEGRAADGRGTAPAHDPSSRVDGAA